MFVPSTLSLIALTNHRTGTFVPTLAPAHTPLAAIAWNFNAPHVRLYWRNENSRLMNYTYIEAQTRIPIKGPNPCVLDSPETVEKGEGLVVCEWDSGKQRRMYVRGEGVGFRELTWRNGRWMGEQMV
jgi:hypothetical protein